MAHSVLSLLPWCAPRLLGSSCEIAVRDFRAQQCRGLAHKPRLRGRTALEFQNTQLPPSPLCFLSFVPSLFGFFIFFSVKDQRLYFLFFKVNTNKRDADHLAQF